MLNLQKFIFFTIRQVAARTTESGDKVRILSFDQASTMGWAVIDDGETLIDYGTIKFKKHYSVDAQPKYNLDFMAWCKRCLDMKSFVFSKIEEFEPDLVVFEGIQDNRNHDTHSKLAGLLAILSSAMEEKQIEYIIYRISNWKTDSGIPLMVMGDSGRKVKSKRDFQKAESKRLAKELFNVDVSEDEADAIMMNYAAHKTYVRL